MALIWYDILNYVIDRKRYWPIWPSIDYSIVVTYRISYSNFPSQEPAEGLQSEEALQNQEVQDRKCFLKRGNIFGHRYV